MSEVAVNTGASPKSALKRRGLGRGLGALIPEGVSMAPPAAERRVHVSEIRPNPRQPRRYFDERRIAELADSIRQQGVLQPLVVRKADSGYELIVGERRFRAAQRAGLERVPVIVKEVSDAESLEMALVENIQREELTPIEEALAYRQLMDEFQLTQEDVAKRVGKSRPVIANLLRVLNYPRKSRKTLTAAIFRSAMPAPCWPWKRPTSRLRWPVRSSARVYQSEKQRPWSPALWRASNRQQPTTGRPSRKKWPTRRIFT